MGHQVRIALTNNGVLIQEFKPHVLHLKITFEGLGKYTQNIVLSVTKKKKVVSRTAT